MVPRRHESNLFALAPQEQADLWALVRTVRNRLAEELHTEDFTVGANVGVAAGQTVLHAHIVRLERRPAGGDPQRPPSRPSGHPEGAGDRAGRFHPGPRRRPSARGHTPPTRSESRSPRRRAAPGDAEALAVLADAALEYGGDAEGVADGADRDRASVAPPISATASAATRAIRRPLRGDTGPGAEITAGCAAVAAAAGDSVGLEGGSSGVAARSADHLGDLRAVVMPVEEVSREAAVWEESFRLTPSTGTCITDHGTTRRLWICPLPSAYAASML